MRRATRFLRPRLHKDLPPSTKRAAALPPLRAKVRAILNNCLLRGMCIAELCLSPNDHRWQGFMIGCGERGFGSANKYGRNIQWRLDDKAVFEAPIAFRHCSNRTLLNLHAPRHRYLVHV